MKKILITGSSGFIGSKITDYYIQQTNIDLFLLTNLHSSDAHIKAS